MTPFKFLILVFPLCFISCSEEIKSESAKVKGRVEHPDIGELNCVPDEVFASGNSGLFPEEVDIVIYSYEDTTYTESPSKLTKGKFTSINVQESIKLNRKQIIELENILFSTRTNSRTGEHVEMGCYEPRHSIVFYHNEEALAFYEFCFQCEGQRTSDTSLREIDFCLEKWDNLKSFFKGIGITYFGPGE